MKGLRLAAAAAALLALGAAARSDGATANRDRRFFSARAGVGLEAPPGWNLSLHTGYPTVLCLLIHPGGSRISLAVDAAVTAADAAALAAESRPGLAAQGIEVTGVAPGPRGGVLLEARFPRRNQALRQLYLVRAVEGGAPPARQAVVLTLTTTPADLAAAGAALDWVIARLDLEKPLPPDDRPADRPDGGR
ncbi:MAG TPA: hypothetical protein VHO06_21860 [Polyangia bacterium]|nr:hypothetical protein [Polyangia bacterium]